MVSGIGLIVLTRLRRRDPATGWTIASAGLPDLGGRVQLRQGIFHPYYVSFLAPFSAALVGAGAAQMREAIVHARIWRRSRSRPAGNRARRGHSQDTIAWLKPVLIAAAALAAFTLALTVGDGRV